MVIYKAVEQGTDKTLDDLERYLNHPGTPGYEILAISGITLSDSVNLSNDLRLVPFSEIPNGVIKNEFVGLKRLLEDNKIFIDLSRVPLPTAALVRSLDIRPKVFFDLDRAVLGDISKKDELKEICLSFTLIGKCTPLPISDWIQPEDWVPCPSTFWGRSSQVHDIPLASMYKPVQIDSNKATQLYNDFSNLDQKTRSELRVPLDRLNQSRRHHNETEKAIDLGIALEALLLNDRERDDSIALPFRLRGAWLLGQGSTPRERKELLDIFNDLYDCRSKAVHKGTLKSGSAKYKSGKTPIEILNIGDELCVKIIEAIITNGGFHNSNEWNELLMGSQL